MFRVTDRFISWPVGLPVRPSVHASVCPVRAVPFNTVCCQDVGAKAKEFGYLSGKYTIDLIVGDAVIENPIVWTIVSTGGAAWRVSPRDMIALVLMVALG